MNKKVLLLVLLALIIAAGASMYALGRNDSSKSSGTSSNIPPVKNEKSDKAITTEGTVECLTPKNPNGPQLAICMIGLKQDDGVTYGLNADDPTITGSIPTGTRVQVVGTVAEPPAEYDTYDLAGVIKVTTVTRL